MPSVIVLGATGSVGGQTLEVAAALGAPVVGVAAFRASPEILAISRTHPEARVVVVGGDTEERAELANRLGGRVGFGPEALADLAATPGATVVNAVVGAAGLEASVAALAAGNRLALANKESLVMAGPVLKQILASQRGELIPVDSEHSALYQLLAGVEDSEVASLVITASGGPFHGQDRAALADVTPAEALRHPTWVMGSRITVDSATLANKGLEVIEAHLLFDVPFDRIEVVVHPQSLIHALIRLTDGSLLAHLGLTDMRIPIQYALTAPARLPAPGGDLDLAGICLSFDPPDRTAFRALDLAYAAGRQGGSAPAVFNAADEVAVAGFLAGRLGFLDIAEVIERTLARIDPHPVTTVAEVLAADQEARRQAMEVAVAL